MSKTVTVLVSKCYWSPTAKRWITYERFSETTFDAEVFFALGGLSTLPTPGRGKCVIVRPNYNREDGSFEEWQSHDGEPFKHIEFAIG